MTRLAAIAVVFAAMLAGAFVDAAPAFARGGAPNIMNSPGYQRALKESRERYRQQYYAAQPRVTQPRKYRRHWRHRRY